MSLSPFFQQSVCHSGRREFIGGPVGLDPGEKEGVGEGLGETVREILHGCPRNGDFLPPIVKTGQAGLAFGRRFEGVENSVAQKLRQRGQLVGQNLRSRRCQWFPRHELGKQVLHLGHLVGQRSPVASGFRTTWANGAPAPVRNSIHSQPLV